MTNLMIDNAKIDEIAQISRPYAVVGEPLLSDFMYAYYQHTPLITIDGYSSENLAGMAVHHYQLLKNALIAKTPKFLLFNSDQNVKFDSPYSILQLASIDKPFLTDTILMCLDELGIAVHRIHTAIVEVGTNDGEVTQINPAILSNQTTDTTQVALVHCEIDHQDDSVLIQITNKLMQKLAVLDVIVSDFEAMKARLTLIKNEINQQATDNTAYKKDEISAFLNWVSHDNFIFMGFREYCFDSDLSQPTLYSVGGSGLGILRNDTDNVISNSFERLPKTLKLKLTESLGLVFSKVGHIAPVHRPAYMDFLGIQKFDDTGKLVGEYRFIGLLTSKAYQANIEHIPVLYEKSQAILQKSKLPKNSHAYTRLAHIINTLPRDDLFQASIDELHQMAIGIANLNNKNELKLFSRTDPYGRFVSCLVYIPRHKFDSLLRQKIQQILLDSYQGSSVGVSTQYNDSSHTRVHFHVRTNPANIRQIDDKTYDKQLENTLNNLLKDWQDEFDKYALQALNTEKLQGLKNTLTDMPASYKEDFDPKQASLDTPYFDNLLTQTDDVLLWNVTQKAEDDKSLSLKVYGKNTPKDLSTILPILENFGVAVVSSDTYEFGQNPKLWLQNYSLYLKNVDSVDLSAVKMQFEEGLDLIQKGRVESDKLNELILTTDLSAYDVVVLRALSRYMVQAKALFSLDYIFDTLVNNRQIAVDVGRLFCAKFHPKSHDALLYQEILGQINHQLNAITSLDEDRIIRQFLDLLSAMVRTNFYQTDEQGNRKDRVSFKFLASQILFLPKPKPMFEIFVYSPKTEGVHLRGGKVARGGLRWSDRMEDFRTEVLGLVKAQMVKNAVIVPVGSKGGFVVKDKTHQKDRNLWQKQGIACYQTFVRGLLDVTDNIVNGQIVPPSNTVRHDEDDPYLVVAADKGTATFSDIANGLSQEYGFWLQDAFASGGSAGYDHKGMGITAKGGWESVKRHFRLMGKDIQNTDDNRNQFSVIGIGDMSGDVFGNGMLLSQNIRLVGAFNHLHIFIDPNPDVLTAFYERERLFNLTGSSWADYDSDLISKGGGVFSRQDKSIAITPQMKQVFDIKEDTLTPNELLNRVLKAPVDLIWNGGIGTYIKASDEEHFEVGDRANDLIRVNGNEVRAKVIGEGGNLGVTQKGRIEYALNGGHIYTDAIDNSGGVNCSDHEVNIKILLGQKVARGEMTLDERNDLLAQMTDKVANLVLRQNYLQPQAIELSAFNARQNLADHASFIAFLENSGRLDRAIEFLPTDEMINERQKNAQGLTNPEFAVLLAYSKMWVYDEMLASELPDNPYFLEELKKYFPDNLAYLFDQMKQHRLHREIICTYLTNALINRLGFEIVFELYQMGFTISQITHAYGIIRDVFGVQKLWDNLSVLDNQIDAHTQLAIENDIRQSFKTAMVWLLTNSSDISDAGAITSAFKTSVQTLVGDQAVYETYFGQAIMQKVGSLTNQGVPADMASEFAKLPIFVQSLDVVALSDTYDEPSAKVAKSYFGVQRAIAFDKLIVSIQNLPTQTVWDKRASEALFAQANKILSQLTKNAIDEGFEVWQDTHKDILAYAKKVLDSAYQEPSFASLSVVINEMDKIAG